MKKSHGKIFSLFALLGTIAFSFFLNTDPVAKEKDYSKHLSFGSAVYVDNLAGKEPVNHEAVLPQLFLIDNKVQHHAAPVLGKVVNKATYKKQVAYHCRNNC